MSNRYTGIKAEYGLGSRRGYASRGSEASDRDGRRIWSATLAEVPVQTARDMVAMSVGAMDDPPAEVARVEILRCC